MNKYIVINSEDIQKRIDELKLLRDNTEIKETWYYIDGKITEAENILSNSKPLEKELGKAFEAGEKRGYELPALQMRGMSVKNTENPNKQDYINNLKLDI